MLQENLLLEAEGYVYTTDNLYNVLLGVAANRGTLQAVCTDWLDLADPETIRRYPNDQLRVEGLPTLQRQLNAALAAQIPKQVYRAPIELLYPIREGRSRQQIGKKGLTTAGLWGAR